MKMKPGVEYKLYVRPRRWPICGCCLQQEICGPYVKKCPRCGALIAGRQGENLKTNAFSKIDE